MPSFRRSSLGRAPEVSAKHDRAVELALDSLRQEVATIVAPSKTRYNATLPINRLPIEPHSNILHLVLQTAPPESHNEWRYYGILTELSLVCRHWHQTIENTPLLWTLATSWAPKVLLCRALAQSQSAPLLVSHPTVYNGGSVYEPPKGFPILDDEEMFLHLVTPHIGRWRSATLCLNTAFAETWLQSLSTSCAPQLQRLRVTWPSRPWLFPNQSTQTPSFKLPQGQLEVLGLTGVTLDWTCVMPRGLRHLELGQLRDVPLSSQKLLDILIGNQGLDTLWLNGITGHDSTPRRAEEYPVVALPRLEHLRLGGCSGWLQALILRQLRIPNLRNVHIRSGVDLDSPDNYTGDAVAHFSTIVDAAISDATSFDLELEDINHIFDIHGPSNSQFSFDLRLSIAVMGLVVEKWFGKGPEAPIELSLEQGFSMHVGTLNRLARLNGVTRMRIAQTEAATEVLAYLGRPTRDVEGATIWPFENLEDIEIFGKYYDEQDVLPMLRTQFGGHVPQNFPPLPAKPPAPLERMICRGIHEVPSHATMAEIEAIVGPRIVVFIAADEEEE